MVRAYDPKVTIIIPIFNGQEFLRECLNSVLNQQFKDFEIIAVDDGSTDSTGEILKSYGKKIQIITNTKNIGQGLSRNKALKSAKGRFVLFLDSDDLLDKECLELTVGLAEKNNPDFVRFDWSYLVKETGGWTSHNHIQKIDFMQKKALKGAECLEILNSPNYFTVLCLYKKSFLQENKIDYDKGQLYEDVVFMTKAAICAQKVIIINEPLYVVRKNPSSVTSSWRKTSRHPRAFNAAVNRSFMITGGSSRATTYVASFFINKFNLYYKTRTTKRDKQAFLEDFLSSLRGVQGLFELEYAPKGLPRKAMVRLNTKQFKILIKASPILHRKLSEVFFNRYY